MKKQDYNAEIKVLLKYAVWDFGHFRMEFQPNGKESFIVMTLTSDCKLTAAFKSLGG